MLSDEVIELVQERLINRIESANTYILKEIGNKLDEIGKLNYSDAHKLAQMMKYGGDYNKIIAKLSEITKLTERDIQEIFNEVAKKDYEFAKQFYDYKKIPYIPYNQNIALKDQVNAITNIIQRDVRGMMNPSVLGYGTINKETGEIPFKGLQQTYYDLIDEAVLSISQGKETFNDIISRQIKAMGNSGLKVIYNSTYMNKEGIIVNRSRRLDSSIRMNIQDGLRTLHNELQEEFGKEFGADGYEISVHQNPAVDHQYMQGRQFSKEEYNKLQIDGKATDYEGKTIDINRVSKNGNIFHRPVSQYNCYHYVFSVILGVNSREYSDEQLQEIIDENNKGFTLDGKHYTNYEGTQLQRRLETEIRKQKDIQILAKESNQLDTVRESQQKITELTNKYKELSNVSGLPTKMDRMKVSGYRRINVDKKIENMKPKDIAIHYGDLGKARDTTYWNMNSSRRSTGHYGTGTYFISKEEDERIKDSSFFTRKDRPRKEVDFSNYELYKPLIESEARRLHEGLKAINYSEYDSYDFRFMKDDLIRKGISEDKINNAIRKTKEMKEEYIKKGYDDDYEGQYDSLSTIFMKELGFNGIDVRGLEGYDNTSYGSVIYDLNKKKKR